MNKEQIIILREKSQKILDETDEVLNGLIYAIPVIDRVFGIRKPLLKMIDEIDNHIKEIEHE